VKNGEAVQTLYKHFNCENTIGCLTGALRFDCFSSNYSVISRY